MDCTRLVHARPALETRGEECMCRPDTTQQARLHRCSHRHSHLQAQGLYLCEGRVLEPALTTWAETATCPPARPHEFMKRCREHLKQDEVLASLNVGQKGVLNEAEA